jgi:hypothetical protein
MAESENIQQAKIRARARRMWRADGSPKGQMAEYLERARELQAIEDNPGAGQLPNPMTLHHGEIQPEQPVEEAELMENLGEFPGRADQGERQGSPLVKKKARKLLRES